MGCRNPAREGRVWDKKHKALLRSLHSELRRASKKKSPARTRQRVGDASLCDAESRGRRHESGIKSWLLNLDSRLCIALRCKKIRGSQSS